MNDTNNYCVISRELLLLLRWFCEHDDGALKKLVNRALEKGFSPQIKQDNEDVLDVEEAHAVVFDFFSVLEDSMNQISDENADRLREIMGEEGVAEHAILDPVSTSENGKLSKVLQSTASALRDNPHALPREVFFKEFLKTWSPKDGIVN